MAEGALLQFLMENVTSLVKKEIGVIMGVDKEMEKLSSSLTLIQPVLEDAEAKQFQDKSIQDWLGKLNHIAYEIEDIQDEYSTEVAKQERRGNIFKLKNFFFRHEIGKRIKKVAEELDAVAAERVKLHLRETDHAPQSSQVDGGRETGPILKEPDHIYGRDKDKEKIIDMLVNQVTDKKLSVLPIVGLGGLGKTTLAQLVYNDERVTQHFDIKQWVCVSDDFNSKAVLKKIIKLADASALDLENSDLADLECRLLEVLKHKRYLLVLDDVWNENQDTWFELNSILACGSEGSSIVVTTRLETVATIMSTNGAHCLTRLEEEDCWLLFKQRAFGQENEEHPNLETIGRQIVKKCAGVPLAAKALGGLMRFKRKEKEWMCVKESEIWNLPEETSILAALRLSYLHLPSVSKRCFVYCATFPKDYIMEKGELIFHWMALGCISSDGTREVEDVGDQIWNELVSRSFFQEVDTNWEGQTTFKMHDLFHDLAQSIMENQIPRAQKKTSSASASNSKIREVCIDEHFEVSPSSITVVVSVSALTTIKNYNRVRILKLSGAKLDKLPSAIGNLKHLRWLDLSWSCIRTLPHTFCDLRNLQILDLNNCFDLKSLPKRIRNMTNLRHIFLEECDGLSDMPSRIGELTFLKTLSLFLVGHKTGNQLDELQFLDLGGKLKIGHLDRVQNHVNAKKANLANKPNLRDLELSWGLGRRTPTLDEEVLEALEPHPNLEILSISGFEGSQFPPWMTKMENLTEIRIDNCPNCLRLPPLGDLPLLKSLDLAYLGALEYIAEDENSVRAKFPSLEELRLHSLRNLKGLSKEEVGETFPNLRSLCIDDCHLLMFSFCKLGNLSSLELHFPSYENTTTCNIPEERLEDFCNLKEFSVKNVRENHLSEKWFQSLKSLTKLNIQKSNIVRIPEGWLEYLTALEDLRISQCRELVEVAEEIKYLHLLKHLTLEGLDNMVSLPQGLQQLPSLQSLTLGSLPQLTSLPDWLGNLTSLTKLYIWCCPRVPSLPSSIQGMTNLRSLYISGCPQLARRCEKEKGEDWDKIAHITYRRIH